MPRAESSVNKDAQNSTHQNDAVAKCAKDIVDLSTRPVYLHTSEAGTRMVKDHLCDQRTVQRHVASPETFKASYPGNPIIICIDSDDALARWDLAQWSKSEIRIAVGSWDAWAKTGNVDAASKALQSAYLYEPPRDPDMSVITPRQAGAPLPTLDPFVLGRELGTWVRDTTANGAAPADYFVAILLGVFGGAIGCVRAFVTSNGWSEQPILWFANLGIPGSGKSTANKAVGAALAEVEAELMACFAERERAHEGKILEADAVIAKWKADIQKAVDAGRPAPARPANAVPVPPLTPPRLRVTDATPEALAVLLGEGSRGALVYADELATWFESHGKYNGDSSGFWLASYNGDAHPIDRKGGGHTLIRHNTVSVVGGIQPERLHALALSGGGGEDGLASRFLFCWPQHTGELVLEDEEADEPVSHAVVSRALRRLRALPRETDENGRVVLRQVPFERGAAAMRNKLNAALAKLTANASGHMLYAINKMRGQVHRIAMVLEYARWAAGPDDVPEPASISLAALADAIDLVLRYFKPMAERVYGEGITLPGETDAAELARALLKHRPTVFNARKDRRALGFKRWTAERFAAAIQALEDASWIEYCGERKPDACGMMRKGRRSSDYRVRPEVYAIHDAPALATL